MTRVRRRGGWPTLGRTTVADVADHLWQRHDQLLDQLDALPQVAQHGDPVPGNLPGRSGDDLLLIYTGGRAGRVNRGSVIIPAISTIQGTVPRLRASAR